MARPRTTNRNGRTALLGCGAAVVFLFGLTAMGVLAYGAGVFAVHLLPGYQTAVAAIEKRELEEPLLGVPVTTGAWLGLQLARDETARLELRVRSHAVGSRTQGTVYTTLQDTDDGFQPTIVLLEVDGEVVDVLADNAEANNKELHEQRKTLVADARRLVDRGQPAQALPYAEEAIALDAENPAALTVRADIRRMLDKLPEAEADALEALRLDPELPEALRALARIQGAQEDWEACIETATARIRDAPRDGEAWTIRAQCYQGAGMSRQAIAGAREGCNQGDAEGCELARTRE